MTKPRQNKKIIAFVTLLLFAQPLAPCGKAKTYTTNFPRAEDAVSESGKWVNGRSIGLDWSNVSTRPGLAFGMQSGSDGYDDSTALLDGVWGADQMATATVYSRNQKGGNVYEEVEIRLRSSLSPHRCIGYEVLFRCLKSSESYVQIVRWNGPLGSFTYLADQKGVKYGISNGDVVKATIIGSVITAYLNGVPVAQATDGTYSSGNPGVGFFLQGASGVNRDYGFSSFTASDDPAALAGPSPQFNR